MEVFIGFISWSILWCIIFNIYKDRYLEKYIFFISVLYLIFISGARDISIGTDNMSYYNYFMRELDYNEIGEFYHYQGLLFWSIFYGIKYFFNEYQIVVIITSLISITLISMYIWKESKYKFLSLFIYVSCGFYAIGMSMIRQYVAISIATYSILYIKEKCFKKFILCFMLAVLVHPSAILFLPAYFFANIKINIKNIFIYMLFLFISILLARTTINILSDMFFNGAYGYFVDEEGGGIITFLGYILILSVALFFKGKILMDYKNKVFYNLLWLAIIIQSTAFIFPMASRAAYIYSMSLITFIPEIIYRFNNRYMRILSTTILIALGLFIYLYKFYNLNNIYPYKVFF